MEIEKLVGLLGIGVTGAVVGKVTDKSRFRLTQENFSWVRRKKLVTRDLTKNPKGRLPECSDLILVDGKLDITRLQAVGFSLLIGAWLIIQGLMDPAYSDFNIPPSYLLLIGVSQGAYAAGKFTGKDAISQLNQKLNQVRTLETELRTALLLPRQTNSDLDDKSQSWQMQSDELVLNSVRAHTPEKYLAFEQAAEEARDMVIHLTGTKDAPDVSSIIRGSLPA